MKISRRTFIENSMIIAVATLIPSISMGYEKTNTITYKTFNDALFSSNNNSEHIVTLGHTYEKIGAATYIKDGTSGEKNSGSEGQFYDSDGIGWKITAPLELANFGVFNNNEDESDKIQSAINYAHSQSKEKTVFIKCSGEVLAKELILYNNVTLLGSENEFTLRLIKENTFLIKSLGGSLTNCTFIGSGNNKEQLSEILLIIGETDKINVKTSQIKNVNITDCHFKDSNGYHIFTNNTENVTIKKCKLINCRYAAIMNLSAHNMLCYLNDISNVTCLSKNGNGYGISFSKSKQLKIEESPISNNCSVIACTITDVKSWNALDTHGGNNIKFIKNRIERCAWPVGIVPLKIDNAYGGDIISPQACSIIECTIIGLGMPYSKNKTYGGIAISGSPNDLADSMIIERNHLTNCGSTVLKDTGAITLKYTNNAKISGNVISGSIASPISPLYKNKNRMVFLQRNTIN
jgi:hypothetical protein